MQFNAVIDISSIIWDESDYDSNKHHYFNLLKSISLFLIKLKEEKPIILMRDELLKEMPYSFPANKIPNDYWHIVQQVYSFIANSESNFKSFPDNLTPNLVSLPNLIKPYYSSPVANEVNYLLSKIHTDVEYENVYFTFQYLWDGEDKLKTEVQAVVKEYETIISDQDNQLDDFFDKIKPTFEHSSKHDCRSDRTREAWKNRDTSRNFVSQLSCYCDRNIEIPQNILNKRYDEFFSDSYYYGYDNDNNVYVVFRKTEKNIFHAYDMYDIERVPKEVKNHFNIWKY